jgi:hypothetical protein
MSQEQCWFNPNEEELPMTFQVAMIGSDGWVLASDGQATTQGGIRGTYQTDKIRYQQGVASAPFGEDCADLARNRILAELLTAPTTFLNDDFRRKMEVLAEQVWEAEYQSQSDGRSEDRKLSPLRTRGIIFTTALDGPIWHLAIGKQSALLTSTTKYIGGDSLNPARYFIEEYYDQRLSIRDLSLLAAHAVTKAARWNHMVSGLQLLIWRKGESDPEWLNAADHENRSKLLDKELSKIVQKAMGVPLSVN